MSLDAPLLIGRADSSRTADAADKREREKERGKIEKEREREISIGSRRSVDSTTTWKSASETLLEPRTQLTTIAAERSRFRDSTIAQCQPDPQRRYSNFSIVWTTH